MPGAVLALFDFDGTMAPGNSIVSLVRRALREGKIPPGRLPGILFRAALHRLGLLSAAGAKTPVFRRLARMDPGEAEDFYRRFVRDRLLPRVYPPALKKMEEHQRRGDLVLLVTASAEPYMRHLQGLLPLRAVLATPVDGEGRAGPDCRGEEKVRRVKEWLEQNGLLADWAASWSYGDSLSDLPVLSLTGHPVCVNGKPALRRRRGAMARARWKPRPFRRPY